MGKLVAIKSNGKAHFTCNDHKSPQSGTGSNYSNGSPNVNVYGKPAVRLGDSHSNSCGHTFVACTGSSTVFVNGKPIHRLSDQITGSGSGSCTIPGQSTVFAGG